MSDNTTTVEIEEEAFDEVFDWAAEELVDMGLLIPETEDLADYDGHVELLSMATLQMIGTTENFEVFKQNVGIEASNRSGVFIAEREHEGRTQKLLYATPEWADAVQMELQNAASEIAEVEVPVKE